MEKLIREADILVENFHPGAIDHMGFTWEHIQENQSTSDFWFDQRV
ncbi:putative transferase [Escherichia coli]|uniref:Putative transferase n=1 Tax=Escherichia coli TaxID=562 RepID=A0A377K526_ECOLX|nr:putative transferase [Escherichia coli]